MCWFVGHRITSYNVCYTKLLRVSVGSEIWAGVSDSPLGPWKNAKEDNSPLVASTDFPEVHNIDADCFIDDDGEAYLYWGSGFHWVNGICMAAKLNPDMISFQEEPIDVTPPDYFEAPYMIKRFGKYYLMYSSGKAIDATYKVQIVLNFSGGLAGDHSYLFSPEMATSITSYNVCYTKLLRKFPELDC